MKTLLKIAVFSLSVLCTAETVRADRKVSKKIRVQVEADGRDYHNSIVSIPWNGSNPVTVFETTNGKQLRCISQGESTPEGSKIYWKVDGTLKNGEVREYSIEPSTQPVRVTGEMSISEDKNGNLILQRGNQDILQYNTQIKKLPKYVDPAFRRAGYIHPAWSPAGNILTNINPADHMHHYGIWNPWTSISYDNDKYDLWNLGLKQGTVRFDTVIRTSAGDLFAEIQVKHTHVIFRPGEKQTVDTQEWTMEFTPKEEIVIMQERLSMKAWNTGDKMFMWDFVSDLEPATALPVILKAYRYAGFGFRATAEWTRDNCEMLTSEGKTRHEIDGTNGRWIYVSGQCANGKSGILIMSHPANRMHPEPLRIWNEKANGGRGDAFVNFSPSKNEDWVLEPEHTYRLHYRIVTYDGDMTSERAESLWQEFANTPKVTVK